MNAGRRTIRVTATELQVLEARGIKVIPHPRLVINDPERNASGNAKHHDDPWSYGPCVMPGQLCSKSNGRMIVKFGKHPAIIKSAEARQYVKDFCAQMPKPQTPYEGAVYFQVHAYYADRRRDLDIALIQDCLQEHGIIKNDRQVIKISATRALDKEKPRVWFMLSATPEQDAIEEFEALEAEEKKHQALQDLQDNT